MTKDPYAYLSNLYSHISYKRKQTHHFTLTRDELEAIYKKQKGICKYTGTKMTHIKDGTGYHLANISIDRIDNEKGYHADNIALVCLACNMMKYTMELKDLVKWCKLIAKHNED